MRKRIGKKILRQEGLKPKEIVRQENQRKNLFSKIAMRFMHKEKR